MKDRNLQKVHGRNQTARLNTVRHANVSLYENTREICGYVSQSQKLFIL